MEKKIEGMSESKRASRTCLVFVILVIMISVSLSLLVTNSVFGKAHLEITANASSKSPSWANNSIVNSTSLTGSPLSITKSMRNLNETIPQPGETPYIAENKNYVFSQNRTEISTPTNNSHTGEFRKGVKIAVVMPSFTAAAYNNADATKLRERPERYKFPRILLSYRGSSDIPHPFSSSTSLKTDRLLRTSGSQRASGK